METIFGFGGRGVIRGGSHGSGLLFGSPCVYQCVLRPISVRGSIFVRQTTMSTQASVL